MRNLKRALSLALALVMVLSMMVVGAGAVSIDDFTDADEIVNTEAVTTMVSLGVIDGNDDGSYNPTGTVKRGEMAKLISVMLNGGKDPTLGAMPVTFSDTTGHWAQNYISYVASLGIIDGRGDGTFGPNDDVTGSEAAKMILTALGYRSDIEGFTGPNWAINVQAVANQIDLFNDLVINPDEGLSRDDTAQMLYNAVQSWMVEYRNLEGSYDGIVYPQPLNGTKANSTVLLEKFKVAKVEGVLQATSLISLNGNTTVEGKSRLIDIEYNGEEWADPETYPIAIDNDLLGQRVVIYVKGLNDLAPNAAGVEVVGTAIASDDNTVVDTASRLKDDKAVRDALKGSGIAVDDNGASGIAITYEETAPLAGYKGVTDTADSTRPGLSQRFIDNDGDGTVDIILTRQDTLTKVSSYNEGTEKMYLAGIGSVDFDDVLNPEDVAQGDYVLVYNYDDTYVLAAAETVSGKVTDFVDNTSNGQMVKITIDGTDYGWGSGVNLTSDVLDWENTNVNLDDLVDGTYTLYLDTHGNMLGYVEDEGAVGNYAVITGVNPVSANKNFLEIEVKVIMADGSTGKYEVNLLASANKYGKTGSNSAKEQAMFDQVQGMVDTLVSYSISDGTITLIDPDVSTKSYHGATRANAAGNELEVIDTTAGYTFVNDDSKSVSMTADDRTVFFFKDEEENYSVVSGLSKVTSKGLTSQTDKNSQAIYYQPEGNDAAVRAMFVQVQGEFTSSSNYVYVSGDYRETTVGNDTVYTYPTVTEAGEISSLKTKTSINGGAKEMVHEYQVDGDYVVFGSDDNVVNGRRITSVGNGSIGTVDAKTGGDARSFVTTGANIYDVQDLDNGVIDVERMGIGDVVALVLDEGKVRTAFVYDHVDDEITAQPGGGSATPESGTLEDADGNAINANNFLANGGTAYWNDAGAGDKLNLKPTLPAAKYGGKIVAEYSIDDGDAQDYNSTTGIDIPAAADGQDQGREVTVTLTYAEYETEQYDSDGDGKLDDTRPTDSKLTETCSVTYTIIITGESVAAPEANFTVLDDFIADPDATPGTMDTTKEEDGSTVVPNSWTLTGGIEGQRVQVTFSDLSGVDSATVVSVDGAEKDISLTQDTATTVYTVTGKETAPVIVTVKFEKANQIATEVDYTIIVEPKAQITLNVPGAGVVTGYAGEDVTLTTLSSAAQGVLKANSVFKVGDEFIEIDADSFTMPNVGGDVDPGYTKATIANTDVQGTGADTLFDSVVWTTDGVAADIADDGTVYFKKTLSAQVKLAADQTIVSGTTAADITGVVTDSSSTQVSTAWNVVTRTYDGTEITGDTPTKLVLTMAGDSGKTLTVLDATWTITADATDFAALTGIELTYTATT